MSTENKNQTPFDVVSAIIEYEAGEMSEEDTLKLFSHLIKTGMAWTLQGSYGRAAKSMIDAGFLSQKGEILAGKNMSEEIPTGWKTASLTEILTKEQIKEVDEYVKTQHKAGVQPIDTEFIQGLKKILGKYRDELVLKGVDSDYLAYALLNTSMQNPPSPLKPRLLEAIKHTQNLN